MAKTARKTRTTASITRLAKRRNASKPAKKADQQQVRSGTKQSKAIEMLRTPGGANIEAIIKATGWQQHSVRGFLAGVVRKRLKLNLQSAVQDGVRTYRVLDGPADTRLKTQAARAKS